MNQDWVQKFVDALHHLELREEADPLVALFAPDAGLWTLIKPEPVQGTEAIRQFWNHYRHEFEHIRSVFERIIATEEQAALEWCAEGTLRHNGGEVKYRGVTILRRGDKGITEFASYYDPRPFLQAIGVTERGK